MSAPRATSSPAGRLLFDEQRHPFTGSCPAHRDGKCHGDHAEPDSTCPAYVCSGCGERRPWCFGGHPDERCDACVAGIAVPS